MDIPVSGDGSHFRNGAACKTYLHVLSLVDLYKTIKNSTL